jgi:hypothetical protein
MGGGSSMGDENSAGEAPELSHREAADYVASMLDGLRQVANSARMPFLAYLISVALEEAKSEQAKPDGGPVKA